MDWKVVFAQLSTVVWLIDILLLGPLAFAFYDGNQASILAYGGTLLLFVGLALFFKRLSRGAQNLVGRKEALLVVAMVWLVSGLGGALPFYIEGSVASFADAVFESVSGFTTTGATVIADIDNLSRATNFWRCLSHWVGGMGIIVLFVAIFPQIGVGAKQLFRNESAGPISEGVRPKIRETAITLWWLYSAMTLVCFVSLFLAGMGWFDALCHAFSAIGTAGFSTKTASIGHFQSPPIEWILCFFMFIPAISFHLYYSALKGRFSDIFKSPEARVFLMLNLGVGLTVFALILDRFDDPLDSLRHAMFQTIAVTTSTGFGTDDFDTYPNLARCLLLVCMVIGGCGGSTAGGIKIDRVIIVFKMVLREIRLAVSPREVIAIEIGDRKLSQDIIMSSLIYVGAYAFLAVICTLLMVASGYDLVSAGSSVIACLSSIGPALGAFGAAENYAHAPDWAKIMLSFCMIAGRLEIIVLLAPFMPRFWQR
jgi:trk system potassium uptake protein